MVHKPLSSWVATVDLADAPIAWSDRIATNDGDERSDARVWARFRDQAWRRVAVPVIVDDQPGHALGLRYAHSNEAVIELNDFGQPIAIGSEALTIVDRLESDWPNGQLSTSEHAVLSRENLPLRHALVERLAAEGTPEPNIFWLLPWSLFDEFCQGLLDALRSRMRQAVPRLRHWFNPIGALITPALEQVYEGLRVGDDQAVRVGSTAFCGRLIDLDLARVPATSRRVLADIARLLAARDPLLRHTGRRMAARLTDQDEGLTALRLSARLQPAAASRPDGSYTATLNADPFEITAIVRAGGQLTIVVKGNMTEAEFDSATERYRAIIVPLAISDGGTLTRWYIPVARTPSGFSGQLRTQIQHEMVDLTAAPPIGASEVLNLPTAEVLPSLADLDRAGTRAWSAMAAGAPPNHPLRVAIEQWRERYGL